MSTAMPWAATSPGYAWQELAARPIIQNRPRKGFRPKPPSDETRRERAVAARHEYRGNMCPVCFAARALANGACNCPQD